MIRRRNRANQHHEKSIPAGEQELAPAITSATRLWNEIRERGNDAVSPKDGLTAWFDTGEDKAYVTHRVSASNWATTAIGYDGTGVWHVENTKYGPGTELEPHGAIVGISTTYPLSPDRNCFSSFTVYRQISGDKLEPIEVGGAQIGEPISAVRAQSIAEECSALADVAGVRRHLGAMAAAVDAEMPGV